MKRVKQNYYAPTPPWARKLGDALLTAGSTIATYAVSTNNHTLALVALWVGVGGKFCSNLFSEK